MRRRRARLAALVAGSAVLAWSGHAHPADRAAQSGAAQPRFRTALELVTAEVVVLDRDGAPVRDLAPEDFAVRVGGEPRRIVSVQFVDFTAAWPEAAGAPPLYATNEQAGPGRLIALVVDQGHIRAGGGRSALARLGEWLDRLTPADRVALFTVPPPGTTIPFTHDRARVRDALRRVAGRGARIEGAQYPLGLAEALAIADGDRRALQEAASRYCGGAPACEGDLMADAAAIAGAVRDRTRSSLQALRGVLDTISAIDGPKTILLVSEGLALGRDLDEVADLAAAAAAARAALYVLRLDASAFDAGEARSGVAVAADARVMADGLDTLAGYGRGTVFSLTGSGTGVFDRLTRELSGHYLVAFEATPADRDGRPHPIRVDVARPGVVVRARRELRVAPAEAPADPAAALDARLARTLSAPLLATDLPIRLSTYVLADDEDPTRVRVALSAEVGRDRPGAEEVAIGYALVDGRGRVATAGGERRTLAPARAGEPGPLVYRGSIAAPPGDYTLRLAVVDGGGRAGSVELPVRARLTEAGPLRLGELAVAAYERGAELALPAVPTVDTATLVASLQLYADSPDTLDAAAVRLEIAEDEDAPALVSTEAALAIRGDSPRRVATGEIDASLLPPGRYVARARVSVSGRLVGTVSRRFDRARAAVVPPPDTPPTGSPGAAPSSSAASAAAGPRIEVASLAEPFGRDALLAPDRVAFFLDELVRALPAGVPPALVPAVEEARAGRLTAAAARAAEPPLHPVSTFLRGLAAFAAGDRQGAAALFRSTLQAARGSYAPLVYLGGCYAEGGRDDEAAGAWQTALVGFEDLPLLYGLVADAALRSHDLRTARAIVDDARSRWPDADEFLYRQVLVWLASGRPAEGLAALDTYLARRPTDTAALALGVRALYQVAVAGGVVASGPDDLARARRYADRYEQAGGADRALVRVWLAFLEKRR
jgi:VWFA-related protein